MYGVSIMEAKLNIQCLLQLLSSHFFESLSLQLEFTVWLDSLASEPCDFPALISLALYSQTLLHLSSYMCPNLNLVVYHLSKRLVPQAFVNTNLSFLLFFLKEEK